MSIVATCTSVIDFVLLSRERAFKEIVSGQRRGPISAVMRFVLWTASFPYRWIVAWKNRGFDQGKNVRRADVPVISIGNLTTGGTGKTPIVCYICQRLRELGRRVTILSRGYGTTDSGPNDEALELEIRLPDVPHLQDPDRKKIADIATEELEAEILVLDDGFQHRRLNRDFDLLVIDATEPFGHDYPLPRGLLREPVRNAKRADFVVINRSNFVPPNRLDEIKQRILDVAPDVEIAECATVAHESIDFRGQTTPLSELRGKKVLVFCGIGNPLGFEQTLTELNVELIEPPKIFPDHHQFSREDILELRSWVSSHPDCETVLWYA